MSRGFPILLLAAAVALTAAAPARAQDTPLDDARAQELYDNGAVLYDEGRYEEAILAWQEAYRLSKRPLLFFNMANAAERMGEYQQAIDHLNHYRAYASAEERDALDRRIYNLERRYDDKVASPTDAPSIDPPSLEAPSLEAKSAVAPVPATLSSSPMPAPLGAQQPGATLSGASPALAGGGPPPLSRPPRRGGGAAPIALFTVGGVGLATGATFAALAAGARDQAAASCVGAGKRTLCTDAAAPAIRHDTTYSLVADVGFAFAITGTLGGSVALAARPHAADTALDIPLDSEE
ncbi:MAG: tetratricopeptide repeat protein [Myxococcota bacterium]